MLVEQQMVVTEMRSGHVPVEVLGFEIEREHIRQHGGCAGGDVLHRVATQSCRRFQRSSATQLTDWSMVLFPFWKCIVYIAHGCVGAVLARRRGATCLVEVV